MLLDAFDEVLDKMRLAQQGKIQPTLSFTDKNYNKPLGLNRRMHFGMGNNMAVFGPSGTGKTALVDTEFVINPTLDYLQSSIKGEFARPYYVYRSMERPALEKVAKWLAYTIFLGENSNLLDSSTIFQYSNKKRALDIKDVQIAAAMRDVFIEVSRHIDLVSGPDTPEGLREYMLATLYRRGAYITSDMTNIYNNGVKMPDKSFDQIDGEGRPFTTVEFKKKKLVIKVTQKFNRYFAFDPDEIIITVNDTANRIIGDDALKTLNKHAFNTGTLRDHQACANIDIIQFARETEQLFRRKDGNNNLNVIQADIKGTGDIPNNADVLMSILDPSYFGVNSWGGSSTGGKDGTGWDPLDIDRFHGTVRLLQLIKNSHGETNFKMACVFLGEIGYFHEIPHPRDIKEEDYIRINDQIINNRHRKPKHQTDHDLFNEPKLPF